MVSESIYFINAKHELNFKKLMLKFPEAKDNLEYQTPCYIMSVPLIFNKVEEYLGTFKTPTDWFWRYEWKYVLSKMEEFKDNIEIEGEPTYEVGYDLTPSMVHLGRFSLNMWNGYEYFNLMDCLSRLDETLYKVVQFAIGMRMGKFKYQNFIAK